MDHARPFTGTGLEVRFWTGNRQNIADILSTRNASGLKPKPEPERRPAVPVPEHDLGRYEVDSDGKRRLRLKAPDTLPVLKFANDPNTRRKFAEALSRKCQGGERAEVPGGAEASGRGGRAPVGTPGEAEEFLLELVNGYKPIPSVSWG